MCNLDYIPEHLKCIDLEVIPNFYNGELLFFRCDPKKLNHPYNISLIDLSHNRNFNNQDKYKAEDVLWNTNPKYNFQKHTEKSIIELELEIPQEEYTISVRIHSVVDKNYYVDLKLLHKPLHCNAAHSAFEVSFNQTVLNWDNWNETLGINSGKLKRICKDLRNDLRQFLTNMIISRNLNNKRIKIIS